MKVLDEKTFVPISVLAAVASFAFWLSAVDANGKANTSALSEMSSKTSENFQNILNQREIYESSLTNHIREQDKILREMTDRLGRIEGKLDSIRRAQD